MRATGAQRWPAAGLLLYAIAALICCGAVAVTVHAETLAVLPDGSGPFPTIQAALDAAQPGDTVQLAAGKYSGPGNVDLAFGGKAITLRGLPRSPEVCVIDCADGVWQPPHRAIHFQAAEGSDTRVEGITFVAGQAVGDRPPAGSGGAILCQGASPTLVDCVFRGNRAYAGGAIALEESATQLIRCRFEENTASHGGAVMVFAGTVSLSDCAFIANTGTSGGALSCLAAPLAITSCHFDANSASNGGAIALGQDADAQITLCVLSNNFATFGGGIHCQAAHLALERSTLVLNGAGSGGSILLEQQSQAEIGQTVIAFSTQGRAVGYLSESTLSCICTLIYGNMGGDWHGALAQLENLQGNLWQDPLLVAPEQGDFRPTPASPCLSSNNGCGLRGALAPTEP